MPHWNKQQIIKVIHRGKSTVAEEGAGVYFDMGEARANRILKDGMLYAINETPYELIVHLRDAKKEQA